MAAISPSFQNDYKEKQGTGSQIGPLTCGHQRSIENPYLSNMDRKDVFVVRNHISVARRMLSLLVGWLLLVHSVMFGFMHAPVALAATVHKAASAQSESAQTYVPLIICTANGIKTISIPAEAAENGRPSPHSSSNFEGFQCASCGLGNHAVGMPVEPELPMVHRVKLSNKVTALHITARLHGFCPIAASPRAPPRAI